jgi:hypothetical protein
MHLSPLPGLRLASKPSRQPYQRFRSWCPRIETLEERCLLSGDAVLVWNAYMLKANANDQDPSVVATPDQGGPTRAARAFAIIQAGVFDAVNSIDGSYTPYVIKVPDAQGASMDAAVAQAAHDGLAALYPQQKATFDTELADYLAGIADGPAKTLGIAVGDECAEVCLANRANDGSNNTQSYVPIPYPGYHQVDPLHPDQGFLTPQWGEVRPFVLDSSNQFRAADVGLDPQSRLAFLNSSEYTAAYREVMEVGARNSTVRTPDQTQIGIFWAYDGSPQLGTPPRLYNQIAETIATLEGNTEVQNARLFALVNLALGDAGIACWETKYFYSFWRPIIGIRNASSTGNPYTPEDPNWEPLGAQASNNSGTNFTPPFPSYSSGHATFGSALFQTLRDFYGRDDIHFSFMSDEFNGVTTDDMGNVRPQVTRTYTSLSQAEFENHDSRIYLGIHWRFDQDQGLLAGRNIGDYVFTHVLLPVDTPGHLGTVTGAALVTAPSSGTGPNTLTTVGLVTTNQSGTAVTQPPATTPSTEPAAASAPTTSYQAANPQAVDAALASLDLFAGLLDPALGTGLS